MRVSGLTHVLSISGLHMAMVAGTLFFLVRGLLAAVPPLALGFPIKSLAALVALCGSGIYLVLSGNDWPAQRSFWMLAIVLVGAMAGRAALTLRTVAVAAVLVLALGPESLLEPGTQMSFAATLALVAAYEQWTGLRVRPVSGSLVLRAIARGGLFVAALSLTSVVAGAATAPYAALHFQRLGIMGLLSNLAAMPAVEFLVMPFGLLGVLLMPFGWDFIAWPVMGLGIDIMVKVSDVVAALPGADMRTDWVGPTVAGCATLALLALCLLRGLLRLMAVPFAALGLLLLGPPPRPDVLIAPNGQTVAVRGDDGRLSIVGVRSARLVAEQWLSREADVRNADAPGLASAFSCDARLCTASLPDGTRLALVRKEDALPAACREASIVVSPSGGQAGCAARLFTPQTLARSGTIALFLRTGDGVPSTTKAGTSVERPEPAPGPVTPHAEAATAAQTMEAESEGPPPPPPATRKRRMAADHRASLWRERQAERAKQLEAQAQSDPTSMHAPANAPAAVANSDLPTVKNAAASQASSPGDGTAREPVKVFAARWREVATRPPGIQRPWMPPQPDFPKAETDDDTTLRQSEDDARAGL